VLNYLIGYCLPIAGYAVQVFAVYRIYDSFSTTGGFRQLICIRAREFQLTGYVRRLRTDHAEIVFEGDEQSAEAFYDFLKAQPRTTRMFSTLRPCVREFRGRRLYDTFEIERNASITCVSGDHSPEGYETRSVTSADRAVLLGCQN
jgi:acylphosphatase